MINVQGVQGVQGRCAGVKTMRGVACAGCAGVNLLARVRAHVRRLILDFNIKLSPCTPCTPCTCFNNQVVIIFLTLHITLHTLHTIKMTDVIDQKRLQWEKIKAQQPETATWLNAMSKAFGPMAAISVPLASGATIESGQFGQGMNFDNGVKK
jgi:hypothetical protein